MFPVGNIILLSNKPSVISACLEEADEMCLRTWQWWNIFTFTKDSITLYNIKKQEQLSFLPSENALLAHTKLGIHCDYKDHFIRTLHFSLRSSEISIGASLKFPKILFHSISATYNVYSTLKSHPGICWRHILFHCLDFSYTGWYQPQHHQRISCFCQEDKQVSQAWAEAGNSTLIVLDHVLLFHMFGKASSSYQKLN